MLQVRSSLIVDVVWGETFMSIVLHRASGPSVNDKAIRGCAPPDDYHTRDEHHTQQVTGGPFYNTLAQVAGSTK